MKKQYLLDLKQKPFNYVKEEKLHQILMPDESGNTELSHGEWNNNLLKMVAPSIKGWDVVNLNLVGNKNQQIIKELQPIGFTKIRFLILWFNKLQSIEALSRVRLPCLTHMCLANNYINKISELRKISSELLWLEIYENPIIEATVIQKIPVFTSGIFGFVIEDYRSNQINCDVSWLAKVKTKKIDKILINNEERIAQDKVLKTIKKKYRSMRIYLEEKVIP